MDQTFTRKGEVQFKEEVYQMKKLGKVFLIVIAVWVVLSLLTPVWLHNLETIPEQMDHIYQNIATSE